MRVYLRGRVWWGWFYDHRGKRIARSTRCRDKAAAILRVQGWEQLAARPALPRAQKRGFVYFAQSQNSGAIKIGFATDVQRREAQLRVARPDVFMVGAIRGGPSEERFLHRCFADLNLGGEWFAPDDSLIALVKRVSKQ